ncbi:MAG TPA: SNF2-related protein [Terriglobia bacterium]|nr:SNF2-related protein [Terriglobia bacterium]
MKLSQRLSRDFTASARSRGRDYFWQQRVRILQGSNSQVEAKVRGSETYGVSLDWKNGVLSAFCDCPYFDSEGACKHLWATILAAEARGYLSAAESASSLLMDCGTPDNDGVLEDKNTADFPFQLRSPAGPKMAPRRPEWEAQISAIATIRSQSAQPQRGWPAKRELIYVADVPASLNAGGLVLSIAMRERKVNGDWGRIKPLALKASEIAQLPLAEDREIVAALAGSTQHYGYGSVDYFNIPAIYRVMHPLSGSVMHSAARTGRCYLRKTTDPEQLTPLAWDEGDIWQFGLVLSRREPKRWVVSGVFRRGEERLDLAEVDLATQGGLVFARERVARLAEGAPFEWIVHLRRSGVIEAPEADKHKLLAALLCSSGLPALEVPEELQYEEVALVPRPCLRVRARDSRRYDDGRLEAELSFDYAGRMVPAREPARGFYDPEKRHFAVRDFAAEQAAARVLNDLGLRSQTWIYGNEEAGWDLAASKLPRIARTLVEAGWHVEAEGRLLRRAGGFHIEVASGVDWFELHGGVEYGDTQAKLPALLEALRRGENMVRLDDGTYGVVPEEWLRRVGTLAGLGTAEDGHIRFRRTQAGLLDALLASQPEARCDAAFDLVREELRRFEGVEAARQPAGFSGQLRDYQREGLGWMEFLRRFSFGGCLADDMGVGKTAQVLALLETRRERRATGEPLGPSLVVVPRSLIFNWKEEAARFTPQLRVLDHSGLDRNGNEFAAYDLVLSTYGTLRRDILRLKDVDFDYVVLDEAQAIKNATTASAKAARLLRGGHRLVLSGTPVENHLGELWSLFEFLNPGMLGAASVFKLGGAAGRNPSEDIRRLLAHALRPFILRRTKDQVARELPPKTEQTVHCEMDAVQRRLYDELRQHYRNALLKRIETEGLAKSKIQVLEALLRLRQAACHPGLLDPKRRAEPSAKLETLLAQVREVIDAGHKALVFSQFTSFLSIVRDRLDGDGVIYEYLDGATRDRQARVERFQNDPQCPLFLISLKAGGLGLNLTAAEYVFLLDPWWNPAVEAQAMDRAHRIGQTRQVFAYRLIARDTVEEKVLELQNTKRDLAAAIIGADNSLIRNLRREDLELLLS